jgi:peptidoglycan hydrolase FlgJ
MTRIAATPSLATPKVAPPSAQRADLEKAAKAFEAIFLRNLISTMRGAGQGEDVLGSSGVDQFRELADANMASDLANKGSFGIAELLLKQLDKQP